MNLCVYIDFDTNHNNSKDEIQTNFWYNTNKKKQIQNILFWRFEKNLSEMS